VSRLALSRCPTCRASPNLLDATGTANEGYRMRCRGCGATGPTTGGFENAAIAWNQWAAGAAALTPLQARFVLEELGVRDEETYRLACEQFQDDPLGDDDRFAALGAALPQLWSRAHDN
jgi:hypothetical protein